MKPSESQTPSENHPAAGQSGHQDLESQNRELISAVANHSNMKHVHGRELEAAYKRLMDDLDHETVTYYLLPWWRSKRIQFEIFVLILLITLFIVSETRGWDIYDLSLSSCIVLAITILSGLSFVRLATWVLTRPILRRFKIHKYAVFFIRRVKVYVDITLWFALVLLVWYAWFRPQLAEVMKTHHNALRLKYHVTRFLIALILGAMFWLLKNLFYLKLEADLHYGQMFDRIQRSVVFLHGIQLIRNDGNWFFLAAPRKCYLNYYDKQLDSEGGKNIWMDVLRMKKESTPVRILECLANRYLRHVVYDNPSLLEKFESFKDDKKLMDEANDLLQTVVPDKRRHYIKVDDLSKYGLTKEEMEVLFCKYAEKDGNKNEPDNNTKLNNQGVLVIRRDKFLNWVVRAYRSCSNMNRILSSSAAVFIKLNRLISAFIITVVIIIWLIMSRLVDTGQIALVFSPFIAANFMFADSCKRTFDGLIFAFAMHPFDVGDRVVIDNMQMRVDELNILTTIFYKYDTEELLIYPNSKLANMSIVNLDITPDQSDVLNFSIPEDTPLEDVKDLEIKIKIAIDEDPEYESDIKVVRKGIVDSRLHMVLHFKYIVSYLSNDCKEQHKSKILTKIMEFCDEIKDMKKTGRQPSNEIMHFSPGIKPTKMNHVYHLKREILKCIEESGVLGKRYKDHSKVVMTKLTESKEIEIDVYMNNHLHEKDDKVADMEMGTLRDAIKNKLSQIKENEFRDLS